jgi:ISXO2-like transposase domain
VPGGKRGRGAEGKVIIAIAVERKSFGKNSQRWKLGRTRIQVVPDVKAKTLLDFVEDTCEQSRAAQREGVLLVRDPEARPAPTVVFAGIVDLSR